MNKKGLEISKTLMTMALIGKIATEIIDDMKEAVDGEHNENTINEDYEKVTKWKKSTKSNLKTMLKILETIDEDDDEIHVEKGA